MTVAKASYRRSATSVEIAFVLVINNVDSLAADCS